jgi:hypothetical protein
MNLASSSSFVPTRSSYETVPILVAPSSHEASLAFAAQVFVPIIVKVETVFCCPIAIPFPSRSFFVIAKAGCGAALED